MKFVEFAQSYLEAMSETMSFLDIEQIVYCAIVTKCPILYHQPFWTYLCLNRVNVIKYKGESIHLAMMKQALSCPSSRVFLTCFSQFCLSNFDGWYRRSPNSFGSGDHSGGLYFIKLLQDEVYVFGRMGARTLAPVPKECSVMVLDAHSHTILLPDLCRYIKLRKNHIDVFDSRTSSLLFRLLPLPQSCNPNGTAPPPTLYHHLSNIYTANYFAHGNEFIHLSFHSPSSPSWIDDAAESPRHWQLQGLKITGDENVPAGELSFYIDFERFLDPLEAVQLWPVALESPAGYLHLSLFETRQRLPNIALWARGWGQINMDPRYWRPQRVRCSMIVYREPLHRGDVVFSILWDDHEVCMDFRLAKFSFASLDGDWKNISNV